MTKSLRNVGCRDDHQGANFGTSDAPVLPEVKRMLHYALVFLVIAIVAAIFGFGGIAVASAGIAKILFYLFLIAFVISLIMHSSRRV